MALQARHRYIVVRLNEAFGLENEVRPPPVASRETVL